MLKKISILFLFLFFCIGCGTQNTYDSKVIINLTEQIKIDDEKINNAIRLLKDQLGEEIDVYISKDKRSLFVYKITVDFLYNNKHTVLTEYDITGKDPVLRNNIVEDIFIIRVFPLRNGKMIYETEYNVVIYDYVKKIILRKYAKKNMSKGIRLNKDENDFILDGFVVDIKNIYKEKNPLEYNLIYKDNIIIDPINNIIWENDERITHAPVTLVEAIKICSNKPDYKWRPPSINEVENYSYQIYQNHTSAPYYFDIFYSRYSYWIEPESGAGDFSTVYIYDRKNGYDNFSYENYIRKHHVVCVANQN